MLNRVRSFLSILASPDWRRDAAHLVAVELGVLAAMTAGLALAAAPDRRSDEVVRLTRGEIDAKAFARLTAGMDPAMLALASRMTPDMADGPGREGLSTAELRDGDPTVSAGILRLQDLTPDEARAWNASNPTSTLPNPPAKPFRLKTSGMLDEARAVDCMTAAIYYEARWESVEGQRAVAQVVLNRLRHPAYPKSVCGVVFQGSNLKTGCQFSFTCDGAMRKGPIPEIWAANRRLAEEALNGRVMKKVGNATHYHANYVAPYWSPNLVKVSTIGAHIFYRWTGDWGRPPAFSGRYEGAEVVGMQIAALDKVAGAAKLEAVEVGQTVADLPPVVPAEAHAGQSTDIAQPPTLVTAAEATREAEAMTKAEELDWAGRPKRQAPRLAMPSGF